LPLYREHKVSRFKNAFLILTKPELEKRVSVKDPGKRNIYSFYFHFENGRVWDERVTVPLTNRLTDYSEYLDNWNLINQSFELGEYNHEKASKRFRNSGGLKSVEKKLMNLRYK